MKVPHSHMYRVPVHTTPTASTASSVVRPLKALPAQPPPSPGNGLQGPRCETAASLLLTYNNSEISVTTTSLASLEKPRWTCAS